LRGEGRRSDCLLVDGRFFDELTMATILASAAMVPLDTRDSRHHASYPAARRG